MDPKNDSQIHPKPGPGPIFLICCTRCLCCPARCFWSISLFPPVQKHTNNSTKTKPWKHNENTWCFHEKKQEIFKKGFQMVSQKVTRFWKKSTLAPLVAPLAPQVVFLLEKCSQSAPKVVPWLQKWLQKGSQSGKSESQVLHNYKNWQQLRILARRTARSD